MNQVKKKSKNSKFLISSCIASGKSRVSLGPSSEQVSEGRRDSKPHRGLTPGTQVQPLDKSMALKDSFQMAEKMFSITVFKIGKKKKTREISKYSTVGKELNRL